VLLCTLSVRSPPDIKDAIHWLSANLPPFILSNSLLTLFICSGDCFLDLIACKAATTQASLSLLKTVDPLASFKALAIVALDGAFFS
jgi:hypothetical protein